jgi:3-oxoacyl-[acyl-carrier protein] reductase
VTLTPQLRERAEAASELTAGACALVTGADGPLAGAIARALAEDGWALEPGDGDAPALVFVHVIGDELSEPPPALIAAARRALGPMRERGFGRIVFVAAPLRVDRLVGLADTANGDAPPLSAAAREGLVGLARVLALESASYGVTVNVVAPGLVDADSPPPPPEIERLIPARRTALCAEVAECVRFLASPDAGYVTGTALPVDGGLGA